jgi:hypothetical protein
VNPVADPYPTLFHVTHWKAGSQWLLTILKACAGDHYVEPRNDRSQFFHDPIRPGMVYPTVYATRQEFDQVHIPGPYRRFVVIRDPRDTLISGYFSWKISHEAVGHLSQRRRILNALSKEDGLLYLLDSWLDMVTRIQLSWLEAGERLIRYEDLLVLDQQILEPLLLDECGLPVPRERFRRIVQECRFDAITRGRARGEEDVTAHERKGIAGDWRNHFTPRVSRAFKRRYGGLLAALGYERDLNW